MKTLLFSLLCLLTLSQTSYAQKLFTTKASVESYATTSDGLNQSVNGIKANHEAKSSSSIDKNELIKSIHMAAGGVKSMAGQAGSAEQINISVLAKYQMYEWEYLNYLKEQENGSGYYEFKNGDAENLSKYSNSLLTIKGQLKDNFYSLAPGSDNADENLELLQKFSKTYSKFAQLLESRFVEL